MLVFISIFLSSLSSFFPKDTTYPIQIDIKVTKEYLVAHSKEYYNTLYQNDVSITKDAVNEKRFDIDVAIKNISSDTIFIELMDCSWEDYFQINNDYIFFYGKPCNINAPILVKIKPGGSEIYKTTLVKSIKFDYGYVSPVKTTKLGLIILNDLFSPYSLHPGWLEDKSSWKKIVWSNPLYLLK